MKTILILVTTAASLLLSGCRSSQASLDSLRSEISWSSFCDARGYDLNEYTYHTLNEYLDTWCGSADEEAALLEAGVEPY